MYFNVSDEDKNKSGVYRIYNFKNGRSYYGSAKEFNTRFDQHFYYLSKLKHSNKFLKRDFIKTGAEYFVFEILEITSIEERKTMEQMYLDEYWDKQKMCYNIRKKVVFEEKSCNSYTPEETLEKQLKYSSIRREAFFKNCHSAESYEKNGDARAKTFLFINPSGDVISITNLRKFCLNNDLVLTNMSCLYYGKTPSCKGWRKYDESLIGIPYVSQKGNIRKNFKIKNPQGEIFEATNIKDFCLLHGISPGNISGVLCGRRKHHRGWTRAD